MDEKTTKLIKERFDALPQSIQEVILSSHYEESLIEIGKQYSLNVEQLGILERETTMTMMGLIPTKDFEDELGHELNIDKLKVSQIVKDINEKIFLRIRDLLKLMNTPAGEEPSIEEEQIVEITNKNVDQEIMKKAGIEIVEPSPISKTPNPIFMQKMSKPFQIPMTKTEHSLENLSKTQTPEEARVPIVTPTPKIIPPVKTITDIKRTVPQAPKIYPKGGDPYRINPE